MSEIYIPLKKILKEKNMTMTELHQKTGITQKALSLLANGKSKGIQFNTILRIVNVLDISVKDLICVERKGLNQNYSVCIDNPTIKSLAKELSGIQGAEGDLPFKSQKITINVKEDYIELII